MDIKKGVRFLRRNILFYLTGLFVILAVKCYYRQADCDSLLWILAPTVRWVELLGKIPFTYVPGTGYVNHGLRLLIAPSCSGVRFMTITFATLVFSFVHVVASCQGSSVSQASWGAGPMRAGTGALYVKVRGFGWILASALLSWLLTVLVNGLRIITAIYLPVYLEDAGLMGGILTPDRLHTMIGAVVYFIALLTIFRLAEYLIHRKDRTACAETAQEAQGEKGRFLKGFARKCAPPAFWYCALTLGLPALGRLYGGQTEGLKGFSILVLGCCGSILLLYYMLHKIFC